MWTDRQIDSELLNLQQAVGSGISYSTVRELMRQMRDEMRAAHEEQLRTFHSQMSGHNFLYRQYMALLAWARRAYGLIASEFPDHAIVRDAPAEVKGDD